MGAEQNEEDVVEELLDESEVGDGAGLLQEPVHTAGGTATGVIPLTILTLKGSEPMITGPNGPHESSHKLFQLLLLLPGGPVTIIGGELDDFGTATTEINDGGAVNVTVDASVGGITLLSVNT